MTLLASFLITLLNIGYAWLYYSLKNTLCTYVSPNSWSCFFFGLEFLNSFLGYPNPNRYPRFSSSIMPSMNSSPTPLSELANSVIISIILCSLYLVCYLLDNTVNYLHTDLCHQVVNFMRSRHRAFLTTYFPSLSAQISQFSISRCLVLLGLLEPLVIFLCHQGYKKKLFSYLLFFNDL